MYLESIDPLKQEADLSSIGGKIRYHRLNKGMLQKEVATKARLNICTIQRYENNQVEHSLHICNKIAEALDISPDEIYDDYLSFLASNYSNIITSIRIKHKLTQKELAMTLGVNLSSVRRWEKGQTYPSRDNFNKISIFQYLSSLLIFPLVKVFVISSHLLEKSHKIELISVRKE